MGRNRIVVDYGDMCDVVLLGAIETNTGIEQDIFQMQEVKDLLKPKIYKFNSMEEALNSKLDNSEGYVVRFQSGFRVKIKFAEYIRLHKLLTQASSLSIWETLSNGDDLETLLSNVPDEFYSWVKQVKTDLEQKFAAREQEIKQWFSKVMSQKFHNRKDNALFIQNSTPPRMHGILFLMLDGKPYAEQIWKGLRPQFEKPFWNRNEQES